MKEDCELNKETIKEIEEARVRIKKGEYLTHEELVKKLGLKL